MTAVIHGSSYSYPVVMVCLAVWIVAMKCAAMDLRDMDKALGEAVEGALIACHITVTDACTVMRVQESHFRAALRGEGYRRLALNHLIKLGPHFMVHLTASLMWLTAKQRATEILETVSVRKGA